MKLNQISLNVVGLNVVGLNVVGGASVGVLRPQGEPPEGALKDVDGYFVVDRNGKYIVTTEN